VPEPELKYIRDWAAEDAALKAIHDFVVEIETDIQEMAAGMAEALESHVGDKPLIRHRHVLELLIQLRRHPILLVPEKRENADPVDPSHHS
jgi:hypothetical protein